MRGLLFALLAIVFVARAKGIVAVRDVRRQTNGVSFVTLLVESCSGESPTYTWVGSIGGDVQESIRATLGGPVRWYVDVWRGAERDRL